MVDWVTFDIAVLLMAFGIFPSLYIIYLLYDDRRKPGVLWFLVAMGIGGSWAFLYTTFTLVRSPTITLALANVFWTLVAAAAVVMFLLAYEFVYKTVASRRLVTGLFAPVGVFFLLTWINPGNIVYSADYYVGVDGVLYFPQFGGILRFLVVQAYGYLLVFLATGMFVGEILRTSGIQRRQTVYLLVITLALVVSTMIKVAELVPMYYDPTSTVFAFSGLLFAYSIKHHGLLRYVSTAREKTFEEVEDVILVIGSDDVIVDVNRAGRTRFGENIIGNSLQDFLPEYRRSDEQDPTQTIEIEFEGANRYYSVSTSSIEYGRGLTGSIVVLSDITGLKEQETELQLLKAILIRILRHNMRNDLNIINGYAGAMKEVADGEVVAMADAVHERSAALLQHAEKAQLLERVISDKSLVTGSLKAPVERALAESETDGRAIVRTQIDDVVVEHHPEFYLAVKELIDNAITHHSGSDEQRIDIYSETNGGDVFLIIADQGPGIHQSEIDVLQAEEETSLYHGSGVGLWLVRWVVDRSNGDLHATSSDTGTRIKIRLSKGESAVKHS
ncbi:histidine kinase N-terminal 7TM domain-containing protein [Natrialbaceae archaeon A-CW2]